MLRTEEKFIPIYIIGGIMSEKNAARVEMQENRSTKYLIHLMKSSSFLI